MIELGPNRYGKSAIRLVKIVRAPGGNRIRDLTVAVTLEGDLAAAHTDGDNAKVVATDTMKNTVYAFAPEHLTGSIEAFGAVLVRHFVTSPQVERATVSIREHRWAPIPTDAGPSLDARSRCGRRRIRLRPASPAARSVASRPSPRPENHWLWSARR